MTLTHNAMVDDLPENERNSIVVIHRGEGERRSLVEHNDLIAYINKELPLATLNLTVVTFTAAGHVRDHIDVFRRAAVIIGTHGAGMYNVVYAHPGAHVVEIGFPGWRFLDMYVHMSAGCGHHHWVVRSQGSWHTPLNLHWADMVWTLDRIKQALITDWEFRQGRRLGNPQPPRRSQ